MTHVAGYAWACLAVTDLEQSVTWYQQAFGLQPLMTNADTCAVGDPNRFVYLVEPATLFVIGLRQAAGNNSRTFDATAAGLLQLAVDVGPDHLSAILRHLDEQGIGYRGPIPWSTGTVAELNDPDGVPLLLFEPALAHVP